MRDTIVDTFQFLMSSKNHLPDELSPASLEQCLEKIKHLSYEEISSVIDGALRDQRDGVGPSPEILVKIGENTGLRSNQEILIEAVALERQKEMAEQSENNAEVEFLDQLIVIVNRMHERLLLIKQTQTSSVAILADFFCPLSLEVMTDPVIVSSGQTYEKAFIKRWIDLGLKVCPKTRQTLTHTTLIPNYTVKALIANWCETNLATIPEGRNAIGQEGGIPLLVEVVELGSARGKENAAAALLQLSTNSGRFCNMVLQEGAVPPLVALSQSGTPRAREKAQALLSYFRNQRHGNAGRG